MDNKLAGSVCVETLAQSLDLEYGGLNHSFSHVVPLSAAVDGSLCYSKKVLDEPRSDTAVVIAPTGSAVSVGSVIFSDNPRLSFAKALIWLNREVGFSECENKQEVHPTAKISPLAYIGRGVRIGAGTCVGPFAVLNSGVTIGKFCEIKPSAVIGEDGFAFERDIDGNPIRLIHLGSVIIGDNVEVGSFTTVCRGTLANTIIEDDVKIDSHVHIAHNCKIDRGALIIACAEISGGVNVGAFSWIGPNASVIQKVVLGPNSFVGIAANVTRSVDAGATVVGNPARVLVRTSK